MLCRQLSFEWSANEQYSYGWFVPFFAAFLFWLRWEDWGKAENEQQKPENKSSRPRQLPLFPLFTFTFLLLAALLPIRLFEVANPDWRPLSWAHSLVVVGYSLLVIGYWGGQRAVRHFAFPVCFILVAVPWITPIEGPLVQGLMRVVASIATEALTLCGIPAQLEGSLIRVSNGVVGVNEACSGVRSLQTSLMIGLLFGELKRLTIPRRIALVAAALAIAFLANCGRAFFLVWIAATRNLAAVEHWHDTAGYAIVGAVFVGTVALASWLASMEGRAPSRPRLGDRLDDPPSTEPRVASPALSDRHGHRSTLPSSFLLLTFAFLLCAEGAISFWYRWRERQFIATPAWTVEWPEKALGFRELPIAESIRSTLRFDRGREAMWQATLAPNEHAAKSGRVTMFFFRWEPGSASILRARAHRPDICLPNTGWRLTSDEGVRQYAVGDGLRLPFRHFRFVREIGGARPVYADAFFCQHEDRVPSREPDRFDATSGQTGNWMRSDRVRVVREGLRNQGQQVMEVVFLSPKDRGGEEAEADFAELLPGLIRRKR